MLQVYSATVCPFAQRVRALLVHLDVRFAVEEIDLQQRDEDFLKQSPTGRVPMLVDGPRKLYESTIINEFLAAKYGGDDMLPRDDDYLRARERLAMMQWDAVVLPAFYAALHNPAAIDDATRRAVRAELDELVATIHAMESARRPAATLLAFQLAPFWARMDWLRSDVKIVEMIDERIMLRRWLDHAVALPAITSTLPDREQTVERYRQMAGSEH